MVLSLRADSQSRPLTTAALTHSAPALLQLYHYDIDTNRFHDPTTMRFRHHHPQRLDVAAMRAAAALLVGTHDFAQFSNLDPVGRVRNPVKTLWRFDVLELEGGLRLKVGWGLGRG